MYFTLTLHDYLEKIKHDIMFNDIDTSTCPICYNVKLTDVNFYKHFRRCYLTNNLNKILSSNYNKTNRIVNLKSEMRDLLSRAPDYDIIRIL